MPQRYTKYQWVIIRELYQSKDGLSPYYFGRKHLLTPAELFNIITPLITNGTIVLDGMKIRLSPQGRISVASSNRLSSDSLVKTWREVPEEFKQAKMDVNEPYAPIRSRLSKELKTEG